MKNLLLAGAAAAAILVIVPAGAQPAPPPPPGVADGTGPAPRLETRIHRMPMKAETRDDMVAHVRKMFGKLDTNRDGFITRPEADAAHEKLAAAMHDKFAKRLAKGGFGHTDRGAAFDRLDTNKDGAITREEFMAVQPQLKEHRMRMMHDGDRTAAADGAPGEPHAKMMRMHGLGAMHGRMFEMADGNHDGRVTLEEMTSAAVRHFDAGDANHDGTLSPEERMQMHQRMKAEHAKPA